MIADTPNGVTKRWKRRRGLNRTDRVPDPTPLEIARRAALIRATWDDVTRLKRAGLIPEDFDVEVTRVETVGLSPSKRPW